MDKFVPKSLDHGLISLCPNLESFVPTANSAKIAETDNFKDLLMLKGDGVVENCEEHVTYKVIEILQELLLVVTESVAINPASISNVQWQKVEAVSVSF
jgi:hypothetical protein